MREADSQRCDTVNKASALRCRVMQTVKTSPGEISHEEM